MIMYCGKIFKYNLIAVSDSSPTDEDRMITIIKHHYPRSTEPHSCPHFHFTQSLGKVSKVSVH